MKTAVLGAYGGIGQNICRMLLKLPDMEVIAAGRNKESAEKILADIWNRIEYIDSTLLSETDAEIVINAAGISGDAEAEIMSMCREKNIRYISTGQMQEKSSGTNCIFDAGSMPGLSLLLPRAAAEKLGGDIDSAEVYYCVQDSFSRNAAKDFIEGLSDTGKSMMTFYDNGELVPYTAASGTIPYIDGEKKIYAFFDSESEALVKYLGLKSELSAMALEGGRTIRALEESRRLYETAPDEAIEKLCRASGLDTFEIGRYCAIYTEIRSDKGTCGCFVGCTSSGRLTASGAVLCTELIRRGILTDYFGKLGDIAINSDILDIVQSLADEYHFDISGSDEDELLTGEI